MLWALTESDLRGHRLHVYADSQNIVTLGARRERLERSGFKNARGETLAHEQLYRYFYDICDELDITFEKVKGHSKHDLKSAIERVFAVVDRAARQALRKAGG